MLTSSANDSRRPAGIVLLSFFFAFGGFAALLTMLLLQVPGTTLDLGWHANPQARGGFAQAQWALLLMAAAALGCFVACAGLWRRRLWGLWIAILLLFISLVGDVVNAIAAHDYHSLIGLPVAGAMIAYLLS